MGRLIVVCAVVLFVATSSFGQDCEELKPRLDRAETRLRDWPALARYSEDNKKTAPPAKNEQRVVFIGDSITDQQGYAVMAPLAQAAIDQSLKRRR